MLVRVTRCLAEGVGCVANVRLTQSQTEDLGLLLVEAQLDAPAASQRQLPLHRLQLFPESPR